MTTIYQVAVPSPLRTSFDYLAPASNQHPLPPGVRVLVPFGARKLVGVVIGIADSASISRDKVKPIIEVLDNESLIPAALLDQLLWASRYYHHPVGEVLLGALPSLLRKGKSLPELEQRFWQLTTRGKGLPKGGLKRARRQQQLLDLLLERGRLNREQLKLEEVPMGAVNAMIEKGLVEEQKDAPASLRDAELLSEPELALNPQQQQAVDAIGVAGFNCFLLHGETGSGKTEVYLQLIAKVLSEGKQALVLIPEISLTPQTVGRFQRRFNRTVAVLHSGLSDRQRLEAWEQARRGVADIVIGTRSAIFTPMPRLGVVIVDEEHDTSFKQQDGFRYNARDLAVDRARRMAVPALLGSATPSLESLRNVELGRYRLLTLTERAGGALPPSWRVIDIRQQSLSSGLSLPLVDAMRQELDAGNQVLVFLNRRGFSPTLMCHDCGWVAECPRCEVRMTVHKGKGRLICHHCEHSRRIADTCPNCFSNQLEFLGQGTERGEQELNQLFPGVPVHRVDRDTTRSVSGVQKLVATVDEGNPCILVGTQMLAKGHHFPGVTLVAIIDADGGLFSADFRGLERMGQLITQVAGRAGRGDRPGTVYLQTHFSDHPLIQMLANNDYPQFAREMLKERRVSEMPPYRHLALVRAEAHQMQLPQNFLRQARQLAEQLMPSSADNFYLGPLPAPMEKRSGRFRFQLLLSFASRQQLHGVLDSWINQLAGVKDSRKVRWSIDVDPQDMI